MVFISKHQTLKTTIAIRNYVPRAMVNTLANAPLKGRRHVENQLVKENLCLEIGMLLVANTSSKMAKLVTTAGDAVNRVRMPRRTQKNVKLYLSH
jgi:hypothetical protein